MSNLHFASLLAREWFPFLKKLLTDDSDNLNDAKVRQSIQTELLGYPNTDPSKMEPCLRVIIDLINSPKSGINISKALSDILKIFIGPSLGRVSVADIQHYLMGDISTNVALCLYAFESSSFPLNVDDIYQLFSSELTTVERATQLSSLLASESEDDTDEPSQLDVKTLFDFLQGNYLDSEGVLDMLEDWIYGRSVSTNLANFFKDSTYSDNKIHSPFAVLCQRSGSGKTRGMFALGEEKALVSYVCLRDVLKSPDNIIKFFTDPINPLEGIKFEGSDHLSRQALFVCFFYACAQYMIDEYIKLSKKMEIQVVEKKVFLTHFLSIFQPGIDSARATEAWTSILEAAKDSFDEATLALKTRALDLMQSKKNQVLSPSFVVKTIVDPLDTTNLKKLGLGNISYLKKFVIAIDEAQALISFLYEKSAFQNLRDALRAMNNQKSYFMLLADTNSHLSDFAPSRRSAMSSFRVEPNTDLIPPFYYFFSNDLFATNYLKRVKDTNAMEPNNGWWTFLSDRDKLPTLSNENEADMDIDDSFQGHTLNPLKKLPAGFHNEFMKLGSPLWNSFMSYCDVWTPESLFRFAARKLAGGDRTPSLNSVFASLACKFNLAFLPDSDLARDLVAESMAQLTYLSPDRNHVHIEYPSDPVLAKGATYILIQYGNALKPLMEGVKTGVINAGSSGESVGQIILVSAADAVSSPHSMESFKLTDYLKKLFRSDIYKLIVRNSKLFLNMSPDIDQSKKKIRADPKIRECPRMFFNHFMKLNGRMTLENFISGLARGAGVAGNSNETGVDATFSFVLPNGVVSGIFFQFKNWAENASGNELMLILQNLNNTVAKLFDSCHEDANRYAIKVLVNLRQGLGVSVPPCWQDGCLVIQDGTLDCFKCFGWGESGESAENKKILRELLFSVKSFERQRNAAFSDKIVKFAKKLDKATDPTVLR